MKVRHGGVEDAGRVAALLNRIIRERDGTALSVPVTPEEVRFLSGLLVGGALLLAEGPCGELLGFQSVERRGPAWGEIGTFVERAARGRGVGRRLLGATLTWAGSAGVRLLRAEVAADNAGGLRA